MDVTDVSNTLEELTAETAWLRRLARSLVQDAAAAEDLLHDAYVVAAEQRPDDGRPLRPWLVRMMRNLSRMGRRGARRRAERERAVADLAREPATPAELVDRIEIHRLLASLVLSLDPPTRDVVLLSYGEGLTSQQVGQRLGIAAGTVRWRLKLALDELRDKLDAHQPKRAWVPALLAFAGIPRPTASVGLKLLVAAAITLVVIAGWIALQVRDFQSAAQASSDSAQSALRATQRSSQVTSASDPSHAGPQALEAPVMPGRRRFVGQVVDAQGRPVADAAVTVTCGLDPFDWSSERMTTRTTSGGVFSALVDSTCQVSAVAHHDGRSAEGFQMRTDEVEPMVLALVPDVLATIHVIDAVTDAPVAGAHVTLQFGFAPNPSGPGTSDATGAARLALLAPALREPDDTSKNLTFIVRAEGYVPVTVIAGTMAADFRKGPIERTVRLAKGITISGHVVGPDGQPVAAAELHVWGPRDHQSLPRGMEDPPEHTDAAGRFETHVPRAGIYAVNAGTASLQPADRSQGVVEIGDRGGAGVIIRLVPRPETGVQGVVVDERGKPVVGARVSSPGQFLASVTTDDKGQFRLRDPHTAFQLIARSGELASEVARIDPKPDQITRVTLTLGPAGITGVVVDASGVPVAKAQLWVNHDGLASWGTGLSQRYFTDDRGGFTLDVPRGAFRISVRRSFDDDFLDQDDVVLDGGTRGARIVLP